MTIDEKFRSEFLEGLGWLLLQANYLEDALIDFYWLLSTCDEETMLREVRGMTMGPLITAVLQKFHARVADSALLMRMSSFKGDLQRALETRNEFVHAFWSFGAGVMHRERTPRGGRVRQELKKYTVAEVREAGDMIGDVAETVWDFEDDVGEAYPSCRRGRTGMVTLDGTYIPQE